MKTSTKLLIIFFACIPLSLWAYNALLMHQLYAHNFTMELRPVSDQIFTEKELPPFKHLVVDGTMVTGEGSSYNRDVTWQPKISLGDMGKPSTTNAIKMLRQYADIVKTRVSNDTLYISFYKKVKYNDGGNYNPYTNISTDLVRVKATDLHSVNAAHAQYTLNGGIKINDVFDVTVSDNSRLDIFDQHINKLNLLVKDSANVSISQNAVTDLHYSLLYRGGLTVSTNSARHYYAGRVDSLAWLTINGNAADTKRFLAQ